MDWHTLAIIHDIDHFVFIRYAFILSEVVKLPTVQIHLVLLSFAYQTDLNLTSYLGIPLREKSADEKYRK